MLIESAENYLKRLRARAAHLPSASEKFKIGDRVELVADYLEDCGHHKGELATIVGFPAGLCMEEMRGDRLVEVLKDGASETSVLHCDYWRKVHLA